MRKILVFLSLIGFAFVARGQQAAQSSLYMLNNFHWNPAYAGFDYSLSAIAGFRKQWSGLEGAPSTQYVNAHFPLEIIHGGIGLKVENDLYGAERNSFVSLAYNFHQPLGNGILGIALGGGLSQKSLDGARLRTPEGFYRDNILDHRDAILPLTLVHGMTSTFETGVFYQTELLESGFGIRHLNAPAIDLTTFQARLERTYYFSLGFNLELSRNITLHPSLLLRSDLIQTQTDLGFILRYHDNIFAGASFRGYNSNSIDAVAFLAGFKLNENFQLGYAYDLTLSPLQQVSNGSHEIVVAYRLNKIFGARRPPRVIYNPRNL